MFYLSMSDSPTMTANLAVSAPIGKNMPAYLSFFGYSTATASFLAKLKQKNKSLSVQRLGYFSTDGGKLFDVFQSKAPGTDYVHTVVSYRDNAEKIEGQNDEYLNIVLFYPGSFPGNFADDKSNKDFFDMLYDKIYKLSPVPLLREWTPYVYHQLMAERLGITLSVVKDPENLPFCVLSFRFRVSKLFEIVTKGIEQKVLKMTDGAQTSENMRNIVGLDSYLNAFGEILSYRIQNSFRPLFVAGEDEFSQKTEIAYDYAKSKGLDMYPAQKATVEALVRCLKKNSSAIVIGQQGSGKTIVSLATLYASLDKFGSTNIVMCPSHLLKKWQREIETYMPHSLARIVDSFHDFCALEPLINDPLRKKHLFLIMSKETAKFDYEQRPAAVWSKRRKCFVCPECGQPLFRRSYTGSGRNRREEICFFGKDAFIHKKPTEYNQHCSNRLFKSEFDTGAQEWETTLCGANLWTSLTREENSDWVQMSEGGWILRSHIEEEIRRLNRDAHSRTAAESKYLSSLVATQGRLTEGASAIRRAPRKYSLGKYIKKYYKNKIDFLLADELKSVGSLMQECI